MRREHPDYAGRLPLDETARIIHGAAGSRGACRQYLNHTLGHLEACGIVDRPLRELARRVAALARTRPAENYDGCDADDTSMTHLPTIIA